MGVLIDEVTEVVKHETIKKQEGGFLGALLASLVASILQAMISSVVKGINGRGVGRARKRYLTKFFSSAPSFKQNRHY